MTRAELPVLRAQLSAERSRITIVVDEIAALLALVGEREPSRVELMAAAGYLHNLYNGIENCMSRLAHGIDESVPTGPESHRLLLDQLAAPVEGLRPALLDAALAAELDELRRYRHAFRHTYFFDLAWDKLRPLLARASAVHAAFEGSLEALLGALGPR
jgi:hypothetical protein